MINITWIWFNALDKFVILYRKWDWIEPLDSPQLAQLKKILDDGAVRKDNVVEHVIGKCGAIALIARSSSKRGTSCGADRPMSLMKPTRKMRWRCDNTDRRAQDPTIRKPNFYRSSAKCSRTPSKLSSTSFYLRFHRPTGFVFPFQVWDSVWKFRTNYLLFNPHHRDQSSQEGTHYTLAGITTGTEIKKQRTWKLGHLWVGEEAEAWMKHHVHRMKVWWKEDKLVQTRDWTLGHDGNNMKFGLFSWSTLNGSTS